MTSLRQTLTVIGPHGSEVTVLKPGLGQVIVIAQAGATVRGMRFDHATQRVGPLRPLPLREGRGHHRHHRPLSNGRSTAGATRPRPIPRRPLCVNCHRMPGGIEVACDRCDSRGVFLPDLARRQWRASLWAVCRACRIHPCAFGGGPPRTSEDQERIAQNNSITATSCARVYQRVQCALRRSLLVCQSPQACRPA